MNIRCAICGEEIVIEGDLSDGQHVLCPYCGGKSQFSRPTRIELPTGARQRSDVARKQPDAAAVPTETPAADIPQERKPLRVIRKKPESAEGQNSVEAQMASRRLHMAEENVRFYEEMKDIENRRKLREKFGSILMLLAVVLCGVSVYWYIGHRKEQQRQSEIAFAEEKARIEAEQRQKKLMQEEAERAEREKRLAEEKLRKERARAEAAQEEERRRAEATKAANDLMEAKVLYRKACALFADGEFGFMKALPDDAIPGKAVGEYYYLLPFLENGEIVVCRSTAAGIESVCRLDGNGKRTPLDIDTFQAMLQGKDYLLAFGEKVYFQSKRKKFHVGQIPKTEVIDLTQEFFGDIAPEVKRLDLDPDELRFEIVFVSKETKKVIVADTVEYGARYSLEKVREALEDAFPMRKSSSSIDRGKTKKFKRTVVFWDGAHVKDGIDGVTYVPKVEPAPEARTSVYGYGWHWSNESRLAEKRHNRNARNHARWQALYEEAKKQEEAEMRYYEEQANEKARRQQSALSQAEQEYAARIDRIYAAGTLYFRAKVEKPK